MPKYTENSVIVSIRHKTRIFFPWSFSKEDFWEEHRDKFNFKVFKNESLSVIYRFWLEPGCLDNASFWGWNKWKLNRFQHVLKYLKIMELIFILPCIYQFEYFCIFAIFYYFHISYKYTFLTKTHFLQIQIESDKSSDVFHSH